MEITEVCEAGEVEATVAISFENGKQVNMKYWEIGLTELTCGKTSPSLPL